MRTEQHAARVGAAAPARDWAPPRRQEAVPATPVVAAKDWQVEITRGGAEIIEAYAEEWRALCREGRHAQPFFQPDWFSAYLSSFAPLQRILLLTARRGGRLRAVLPLMERSLHRFGWPVRCLQSITNLHSCRFDVIAAPGEEGNAAVARLWETLRDYSGWDLISLSLVPAGGAAEGISADANLDGFPVAMADTWASPFIPLRQENGGSAVTSIPHSGHMGRNLRRWRRHLALRGEIALYRTSWADPNVLRDFYRLEAASWKGRRRTAILQDPARCAFYNRIARFAAAQGSLALYVLSLGGRTIAAQFGLTSGSAYFVPKCAYDESLTSYGPGHLLVQAVLEDCAARGITEFDFLGTDEEWKLRWTSHTRLHNTWHIYRDNRTGRALYSLRFRIKPALKHALHL